jgi:low affinity Fe/Cu permease
VWGVNPLWFGISCSQLVRGLSRTTAVGWEQSSISSRLPSMRRTFADIATTIAQRSGRPVTFIVALVAILVWAVTGPLFHFSDTWQLIINTSTTIITFLMVFVIQNTQNRDGAAIQAKLDELIRVSSARNSLIGIETLTQDEIEEIRATCAAKARPAVNGTVTQMNKKAKGTAGEAIA